MRSSTPRPASWYSGPWCKRASSSWSGANPPSSTHASEEIFCAASRFGQASETGHHAAEIAVQLLEQPGVPGQIAHIGSPQRQTGIGEARRRGDPARIMGAQGKGGEFIPRVGLGPLTKLRSLRVAFERLEAIPEIECDPGDRTTVEDRVAHAFGRDPVRALESVGRRSVGLEEADRRLLSDEGRDPFVEAGVALQEGGGMDELVQQGLDEARNAEPQHR
jgi:hypothetical protein